MLQITGPPDFTQTATVETMSAYLIERFGDHATDVAVRQLAVAHATGAPSTEFWMSIFLSIEERTEHGVPI